MLRLFSCVSEALGCFCFYYGTTMLFVVPGGPGEPYLDWPRVKYGIAPTVLSIIFICLSGWLWSRSGPPASLDKNLKRAFQGAVAAVVLFWVGLVIAAHLLGKMP
jgi:hypothetical protein